MLWQKIPVTSIKRAGCRCWYGKRRPQLKVLFKFQDAFILATPGSLGCARAWCCAAIEYNYFRTVWPRPASIPLTYVPKPIERIQILTFCLANTTGIGWEDAIVKARSFVSQLTLEEKSDMVTGTPGPCIGNIVAIPRLGFSGLCLQDGPLAIRIVDYASTFPAGVSAAATFDRELIYERGLALGAEFRAKGAQIALG